MARSEVAILVAGMGRMGSFHARTLAGRVPGARLCAVADADGERARAAGEELAVPWYADMETALSRSGAAAVVVASPSDTHAAWTTAAAGRGLAVLCEKPLAPDLASARQMVAAAARAAVPLQVGFQRRHDRGFAALRDSVQAGALGRPLLVKSASRDPEISPLDYLRGSGGIFQDQMIHDIDILRYLSGREIVEVYAAGGAFFEPALVPLQDADTACLVARFDDGTLGIADASRQCGYGHDVSAEVFGDRGTARLERAKDPPVTTYTARGAAWQTPHWFLERFAEAYERELAAFADVVRGTAEPLASGLDGLRAMEVADAARRSLATGGPQAVSLWPVPGLSGTTPG